jgi:hypothetical protein
MTFCKIYRFTILFVICFSTLNARIIPADQSTIHYTTVYFQEDFFTGSENYRILLSKDSLFENLISTGKLQASELPAFWISDLEWGQTYFWKVNAYNKTGNVIKPGKAHKFKILAITTRNFDEVKLTVNINKPGKHSAGFIAIDNARSVFDRTGKALWTIPPIEGLVDDNTQVRDLKMTKEHTFTFLAGKIPVEIDFEGQVIWKGPDPFVLNNDTITFHHDLKKDRAGNYYVLGNKYVYRKLLSHLPEDVIRNEDMVKITDSAVYRKTEIGLLLKFDKNNKLLWCFDFDSYIKDIDLNYKKTMSGFPNFNSHANAFSINKQGTMAYVGFRDLSRIVKVDIKTKKIVSAYGEKFPSGEAQFCNNLFRSQHDACITNHNSILVFNNNGSRSGGISSVIEFKDTFGPKDSILIWKLELGFDNLTSGKSLKGGNVAELQNSNLFVCAGELNRIFEVTRAKEIVWDAFIYSRGKKDTLWQAFPQYRASVLEKLINHHFMVRSDGFKNQENATVINYFIYNTGNFPDQYLVEVLDEKGIILKEQLTVQIEKNSSLKKNLEVGPKGKYAGNLSLRITSLSSGKRSEVLSFN